MRLWSETEQLLRESLRLNEHNADARAQLAELYWNQLRAAEEAGDRRAAVRAELDLKRLEDSTWSRILDAPGAIKLDARPAATLTLFELEERDRRLQPERPRDLGTTPVSQGQLPAGRYLLLLEAEGFATARLPIRLGRGERLAATVRLFPEDLVGEGFVHIPAGTVRLGGDPGADRGLRAHTAFVPDFAMAKLPVTMAEYLLFLNDLADRDEAWARTPRAEPHGGQYLSRADDGGLSLPAADPNGHRWSPQLPVMAISFDDAVAYVQWRSAREGVRFRLPTDAEWEKAARSPDGRVYPWGDRMEPSYCLTQVALSEVQPRDVGFMAGDVSPYGVRDLAGGGRDWIDGWKTQKRAMRAMRGGAWWDRPEKARLTERTGWPADNVYGDTGLRLVKSLPLEPPAPALVDEDDPRRGGLRTEHLPAQ